jgi:N-acetyl-anhydromuramyl-L-alanine amidase AmpD
MYHYKIDRQGGIYQTRELTDSVWAVSNANDIAINICVDGDLTKQDPTVAQLKSLKELLHSLCNEHPEFPAGQKNVFGHGELTAYQNSTACPGRLLKYVIEFRDTGDIKLPNTQPVPQPTPTPAKKQTAEELINHIEQLLINWRK